MTLMRPKRIFLVFTLLLGLLYFVPNAHAAGVDCLTNQIIPNDPKLEFVDNLLEENVSLPQTYSDTWESGLKTESNLASVQKVNSDIQQHISATDKIVSAGRFIEVSTDAVNWVRTDQLNILMKYNLYFNRVSPLVFMELKATPGGYLRAVTDFQPLHCPKFSIIGPNMRVPNYQLTVTDLATSLAANIAIHPTYEIRSYVNEYTVAYQSLNILSKISTWDFSKGDLNLLPILSKFHSSDNRPLFQLGRLKFVGLSPWNCASYDDKTGLLHLTQSPCKIGVVLFTDNVIDTVQVKSKVQKLVTSIVCVKGKLVKTISAPKPICPVGYKKK